MARQNLRRRDTIAITRRGRRSRAFCSLAKAEGSCTSPRQSPTEATRAALMRVIAIRLWTGEPRRRQRAFSFDAAFRDRYGCRHRLAALRGKIAGNRDPWAVLRGCEGPRSVAKVASDPGAPS